jgi:hypothetical protein
MPVTVKIVVERRPAVSNPSALAKAQATAVRDHSSQALINGYVPDTMEARERKSNGKPLGYDTGKLARGLRVRSAGATRTSSAFAVEPGPDRKMLTEARPELGGMSFIERHKILTLEGVVQDVIAEATDAYMRSLR